VDAGLTSTRGANWRKNAAKGWSHGKKYRGGSKKGEWGVEKGRQFHRVGGKVGVKQGNVKTVVGGGQHQRKKKKKRSKRQVRAENAKEKLRK